MHAGYTRTDPSQVAFWHYLRCHSRRLFQHRPWYSERKENEIANLQDLPAKLADDAGAASRSRLTASDVQRILRFFSRLSLVVDQALEDAHALAIDLSYVRAGEPTDNRNIDFQPEMDLSVFRNHYHEMEDICNRLGILRQQYEVQIRPLLRDVGTAEWADLFNLISQFNALSK